MCLPFAPPQVLCHVVATQPQDHQGMCWQGFSVKKGGQGNVLREVPWRNRKPVVTRDPLWGAKLCQTIEWEGGSYAQWEERLVLETEGARWVWTEPTGRVDERGKMGLASIPLLRSSSQDSQPGLLWSTPHLHLWRYRWLWAGDGTQWQSAWLMHKALVHGFVNGSGVLKTSPLSSVATYKFKASFDQTHEAPS